MRKPPPTSDGIPVPPEPRLPTEHERRLLDLLKRCEWGTEGLCPICWPRSEDKGYEGEHEPDCELAAVLSKLSTALEET